MRRILENALVEENVRKRWKAIGEQIAALYTRGEVYDPNFQDALAELVYLAMPADVKLAYRTKAPPKKAHVVDSPANAAKRKLRRDARQRVSNTVKYITKAAYPVLAARKLPTEREGGRGEGRRGGGCGHQGGGGGGRQPLRGGSA